MSKDFKRQNWWKHKRLGEKWRKPRGRDSMMRLGIKGKPPMVSVGYRKPKAHRGLHPSGLEEVLVHNLKELERVDLRKNIVRIASGVGKRLKTKILEKARERGIKIVNPGERK